ncbi:EAL domain-containing protein [Echinimonas agarilytica]|uniref:EAL domain-containing protein n=1 Tax=Echinimonas agarilytica TaxID=1215918 RepID=A0AA41W6Y4_9GAMM|nr:EAL domain-containing protein [Echinimonas agarilytica]MCM2679726.1 EAL domain-containing protein [Echinimonas agarilytica]
MIELVFYISIGFILYAAFNALSFAALNRRNSDKLWFAALAICVGFYQYFTLQYFVSPDIEGSVLALRFQNLFLQICIPLFCAYTAACCQQTRYPRMPYVVVLLLLALMPFNFIMPFGLRYETLEGLRTFTIWGKEVSVLKGNISPISYIQYVICFAVLVWVSLQFKHLIKHSRATTYIACVASLLLVALVSAILIESGHLDFFYLSGFACILLMIQASISQAAERRSNNRKLGITSLKLDQELRRSSAHKTRSNQLVQVVEQSPNAIVICENGGTVTSMNQAGIDFWGGRLDQSNINLLNELAVTYGGFNLRPHAISAMGHLTLPPIKSNKLPNTINQYLPSNITLEFDIYTTVDLNNEIDLIVIYSRDVTEEYFSQQAFEHLARSVSYSSDSSFFDGLVSHLSALVGASAAFVGKITSNKQQIETVSLMVNGKITRNVTYDLNGTPSLKVITDRECHFAQGIQAAFPEDATLRELNIESYVGVPLFDKESEIIGILTILDIKPIVETPHLIHILNILAARASAEIQRQTAETRMNRMAYEDHLTGLPNRARANEHLASLLKTIRSTPQTATLLNANIDHFKMINDELGHSTGDQIINAISIKMRELFPPSVFISRYGGDELLFISMNTSQTAVELAHEVLRAFHQPISIGEHVVDVSATIGIVQLSQHTQSSLAAIRQSELALYHAKDNVRGSFYEYEDSLESEAKNNLIIQTLLKQAITNNELEVHYQPQVNANGKLFGAEALVRWPNSPQGPISPAVFVPIAEQSGLIHKLGDWVFERCIEQLTVWHNNNQFDGHLSINVSAWQFALPGFVERTTERIKRSNLPISYFCIELTETGLLSDIGDTVNKLKQLRTFGLKIALDDFGTGYSSLAYLQQLPLDILKIDKLFVDELETNATSSLASTMISMSHQMKLDVVAEGVETAQQVDALEALKCDIYQGYHFAKPMPAVEFIEWTHRYTTPLNQPDSSRSK